MTIKELMIVAEKLEESERYARARADEISEKMGNLIDDVDKLEDLEKEQRDEYKRAHKRMEQYVTEAWACNHMLDIILEHKVNVELD